MTPRKSYSRYFIILQEEQKGYGMEADKAPSGYAKLEVKNNRSKISYYVQNLKRDRGPYYMILITDKQNPRSLINLGRLNIDDNGRADVNFDYDMNSIGNTNIAMDKIVGAAVVSMNGTITPIMVGFSTTDVPKDWTTYPISKGTTQPGTNGTGTTGTGAGTGVGTGATGTGAGGTGTMGTGTGVGTGAGITGTGATGTGTVGKGTMGTGTGAGTGAGATGAGTVTGVGTGTTGTGAGGTGTMGAGGTGTGAGTTGIGTGAGMGTQPTTGTQNGFIDEFEDYYEDDTIINMTPVNQGATTPRGMDIFDRYEEEIESSKLERHKHKKCKKHKDQQDYCNKHHEYMDDYEDDDCDYCKQHKNHKNNHDDDDNCNHLMMNHMHHEEQDEDNHYEHHMLHHMDDEYDDHKSYNQCKDNKKNYGKYNNWENNENHMYKYNWPLGNTGEFFKNVVKGFEKLGENENIKNCFWYKVAVSKLEDMYCIYDYNKYTVVFYPMICYYPYISKKKNFIIGYKCDDEGKLKYIIYGIPGTKALEDQPYGGKTGFVTWMPSKEEKDMGHWLMYYDFKTNNVVIPIKRS